MQYLFVLLFLYILVHIFLILSSLPIKSYLFKSNVLSIVQYISESDSPVYITAQSNSSLYIHTSHILQTRFIKQVQSSRQVYNYFNPLVTVSQLNKATPSAQVNHMNQFILVLSCISIRINHVSIFSSISKGNNSVSYGQSYNSFHVFSINAQKQYSVQQW